MGGQGCYPAAVLKRFSPILALTAACWLVFLVNNLLWGGQFDKYGIRPRQLSSLPGIVFAPFLHGSYQHLAANSFPLLVLGGILCARSKGEFVVVTVAGIVLGGGLTWLLARNACHIGASGLIFCYFGYLASLAISIGHSEPCAYLSCASWATGDWSGVLSPPPPPSPGKATSAAW